MKAQQAEYHRRRPQRRKVQKYGLTEDVFFRMEAEAGGRCAICRAAAKLCVDHDHATGMVRALVCKPCNTALGQFKDDPARMRAAADYIERYAGREHPQLSLEVEADGTITKANA